MSDNAIRLTEGEAVTYTLTVKRDGSAVDVSAATVTFWLHDDDAAFGTNKIDGETTGFTTDGTDGLVTYAFSAANTTFATDREIKGRWALKIVTGAVVEWTKQEPAYIVRNPFVAEG
jgi:hypothetical protein